MECTTCRMIALIDEGYPVRQSLFGTRHGRCMWHAWEEDSVWRCDACGRKVCAEEVSFCLTQKKYVCARCTNSKRSVTSFWVWRNTLILQCPFCRSCHPTLPMQEFLGEHPWQADPFSCRDFPIWYPGGGLIREDEIEKP